MNYTSVKEAKREAEEFVKRAKELLIDYPSSPVIYIDSNAKSGALRRQSMELTRALAKMRKP
jgi:glutaredoxin